MTCWEVNRMSTKIAVVGSAEFMERINSVSLQIPDIEIDAYIYQEPQEVNNLMRTLQPCDVVFYSGALPYYFSKEWREQYQIPTLYLRQDEMAVASTLLSIFYEKKISLERISIDLSDASYVTNVLEDIEIEVQPLHVIDYHEMLEQQFDLTKIITFHQNLWNLGIIDLAITSVHAVHDQLEQLGVPVIRMNSPKIALIKGLQAAKSKADLIKSQSAKVAVGYINIDKLCSQKREMLNAFAHDIHASIQQKDETLFALYSTQGDIETLMKKDVWHDFFAKTNGDKHAGFGYGESMTEADQNAKIALRFAENERDESSVYILTENKELRGPFPQEHKQQRLINDHPKLLKIAKQTKLSPANLSKVIQFGKSRNSLHFTAANLSDYLQVTRRSTERILKKLVDHGYVRVIGEEMTYQQGRPRAVYELNIPLYN